MADTQLVLGDFIFSAFEIPERIPFGGGQKLVTHHLPGGARVVDAMGSENTSLAWTGLFFGEAALDRARYVDFLRVQGKPLQLLWSEFNYTVVIESFTCSFERAYKLPYSISCYAVQDNTKPNTTYFPSGFDDSINGDMTEAQTTGALIADGPLSTVLNTLNTAISAVSTFANAAQATINSVLTPLAAVQARVNVLLGSVGNVVTNVTTIGGVLPNNPIATTAANLLAQVNALNQLPQLYHLQSVLTRMHGNLGLIQSAPNAQQVTIAGGNLFTIASQQYGDATQWGVIAQANNLTDPVVTGVKTLTIPTVPSA